MPPKTQRKKLKIVKIPLDYLPEDIPAKFPPMPILYLELLENKQKIKPELRNKEYVPKVLSQMDLLNTNSSGLSLKPMKEKINSESSTSDSKYSKSSEPDIHFEDDKQTSSDKREDNSSGKKEDSKKSSDKKPSKSSDKDGKRKILDFTDFDSSKSSDKSTSKYKEDMALKDDEDRQREKREKDRDEREKNDRSKKERRSSRRNREERESERESRRHHDKEKSSRHHTHTRSRHHTRHRSKDRTREDRKRRHDRESEDRTREDREKSKDKSDQEKESKSRYDKEDIPKKTESSKRLEELLRGGSSSGQSEGEKTSENRDTNHNNRDGTSTETTNTTGTNENKTPEIGVPRVPPRLSDIEKGEVNQANYRVGGASVPLRDMTRLTQGEEEEVNKKRELLFRFDILRRSYKGAVIPEYSEYTDLATMQKSYDDSVRRLSLDSTVETFKKYLIGGFMVTEFVLGSWFKFDMNGFTQQQLLTMNSYERLLIELGEKSYLSQQSNWPVELRLLFLVIVNAAVFIVSKMVMRSTGANFMNMLNFQPEQTTPIGQQARPKKKMRGPDINLSDLKNGA